MRSNLVSATLVLLLAMTGATPSALASGTVTEEDDKLVLQNAHVTLWFHDKMPSLRILPAGNASGGFVMNLTQVVEYRDLDGDGAPSENEIVARLRLDRADGWNVSTKTSPEGLLVNLTLQAPLALGPGQAVLPGGLPIPERVANVTLLFVLRDAETTYSLGAVDLRIPASAVKWDLLVNAWPHLDAANHRLALDAHVEGLLEAGGLGALDGARIDVNGTDAGYVGWSALAHGTTAAGAPAEGPVKVVLRNATANATRMSVTYDVAGAATLRHASVMGLADGTPAPVLPGGGALVAASNDVPALAPILVAAAVAGAALLARRR